MLYGITVCKTCESDLRLYNDATIARQETEYKASARYDSLKAEVADRLIIMEKDYIKKRIRLLHMLHKLGGV